MDNNNMLKLCRLCLVKDDVNIPIFEEQGDIRQIFLKISSCLPVKVSRDDQLPKKICDGCSYKLDMLYEFWNTSANAEKQLLTWLGEAGMSSQMADGTISAVAQQIKPADAFVKQETIDPPDIHMDDDDDDDEEDKDYMKQEDNSNNVEEPPPKRARRTAAVKAAIALDQNSDDDDDSGEPMTKVEDDSEDSDNEDHEPAFVDVPSTSADDQPGPSGVGKDGVEAPCFYDDRLYSSFSMDSISTTVQLPSFMDLVNSQKQHTITENIMETSVVDQLNDSDELMNLLSTEENCTAILQNISTNEQFQRLMNEESEFVPTEEVEQLINKIQPQTPPQPVINIIDSRVLDTESIDNLASSLNNEIEAEIKTSGNHKSLKKDVHQCDQCGSVLSTKKLLKKHMLIHTKERDFPCEVCGKLFRFRYQVTAHMKSHNKPTYQCEICSQMFVHKSHLNFHRKKHLGEYIATCRGCGMQFRTTKELKEHKSHCHIEDSIICDICGKKLNSLSILKEHKLTHDPNYGKEKPFGCEICPKKFLNLRNLKAHMKIHSNVKSFVCSICGKSVSSKTCLLTHLKMHTGVKDFPCDICNKHFASKDYLMVHKRIHTGDKPFQCNICGKRFTQKTSLTVHVRFHTGQRPYKCECGKQFATKSHLMSHYKTHDIGGVDIEYITNHFI
ncbi:zinc finger protein 718-like isoform X8 [Diorhabda carinulata]|uniref:zinc finger protein 718-like isoform X8 n=1 Tax=Diorhabda carinulata TaxID=1163345 RepID=UPI0025A2333F|nr:zinc finger protein 718-like isoform X8 [Diorhabda carinulata]